MFPEQRQGKCLWDGGGEGSTAGPEGSGGQGWGGIQFSFSGQGVGIGGAELMNALKGSLSAVQRV